MSSNPLVISPLEILNQSTASGMGYSYWKNFRKCGAYQWYNLKHPRVELTQLRAPEPGEKVNMTEVGIFFHKLRELWRLDILDSPEDVVVEWGGDFEPDEWKTACRLFEFYVKTFSRDEWLTVSCEELLEVGCINCATYKHGGFCPDALTVWSVHCGSVTVHIKLCSKAIACLEHFGVPCLSGRMDELAFIDEEQLTKLNSAPRYLGLFDPGFYQIDAKTKKQKYKNLDIQYQELIQFTSYQELWNYLNPDKTVRGMIADSLFPYVKGPVSDSQLITNNPHKIAVMKDFYSKCWQEYVLYGFRTNKECCFDFNKTCYWLTSKECNGLDPVT